MDGQPEFTLSQENIISFRINKQNQNIIWTPLCRRGFAALKQKQQGEVILFHKILVLVCTIKFC